MKVKFQQGCFSLEMFARVDNLTGHESPVKDLPTLNKRLLKRANKEIHDPLKPPGYNLGYNLVNTTHHANGSKVFDARGRVNFRD